MTPEQRAEHLKYTTDLSMANDAIAEGGESCVVDRDEDTNLHFVCFINVDNELYELDSQRPHPVKHQIQEKKLGQTLDLSKSSTDVMFKSTGIVSDDIQFSIMVLTKV